VFDTNSAPKAYKLCSVGPKKCRLVKSCLSASTCCPCSVEDKYVGAWAGTRASCIHINNNNIKPNSDQSFVFAVPWL